MEGAACVLTPSLYKQYFCQKQTIQDHIVQAYGGCFPGNLGGAPTA